MLYLLLFSFAFLTTLSLSSPVFINPSSNCYRNCAETGEYNTLWGAILESTNYDEIILLKNPTNPHFILSFQLHNKQEVAHYENYSIITNSLMIRPLFCDDTNVILPSTITLSEFCVNREELITVYLKTENLSIFIHGNLTIQNIAFEGQEMIENLNPTNQNASFCLQNSILCCNNSSVESSLFQDVVCRSDKFYSNESVDDDSSLFRIENGGILTIRSIKFNSIHLYTKKSIISSSMGSNFFFENSEWNFFYSSSSFFRSTDSDQINHPNSKVVISNSYFARKKNEFFENYYSATSNPSELFHFNQTEVVFQNNSIEGIIIHQKSTIIFIENSKLEIFDLKFFDLEIQEYSSLIYSLASKISLYNCSFNEISAQRATLIKADSGSFLSIHETEFKAFTFKSSIILSFSQGSIVNVIFQNIIVNDNEEVFWISHFIIVNSNLRANFQNLRFENNYLKGSGPIVQISAQFSLSNFTFINNTFITTQGMAFSSLNQMYSDGKTSINGFLLINNHFKSSGTEKNSLFNFDSQELVFENIQIINNDFDGMCTLFELTRIQNTKIFNLTIKNNVQSSISFDFYEIQYLNFFLFSNIISLSSFEVSENNFFSGWIVFSFFQSKFASIDHGLILRNTLTPNYIYSSLFGCSEGKNYFFNNLKISYNIFESFMIAFDIAREQNIYFTNIEFINNSLQGFDYLGGANNLLKFESMCNPVMKNISFLENKIGEYTYPIFAHDLASFTGQEITISDNIILCSGHKCDFFSIITDTQSVYNITNLTFNNNSLLDSPFTKNFIHCTRCLIKLYLSNLTISIPDLSQKFNFIDLEGSVNVIISNFVFTNLTIREKGTLNIIKVSSSLELSSMIELNGFLFDQSSIFGALKYVDADNCYLRMHNGLIKENTYFKAGDASNLFSITNSFISIQSVTFFNNTIFRGTNFIHISKATLSMMNDTNFILNKLEKTENLENYFVQISNSKIKYIDFYAEGNTLGTTQRRFHIFQFIEIDASTVNFFSVNLISNQIKNSLARVLYISKSDLVIDVLNFEENELSEIILFEAISSDDIKILELSLKKNTIFSQNENSLFFTNQIAVLIQSALFQGNFFFGETNIFNDQLSINELSVIKNEFSQSSTMIKLSQINSFTILSARVFDNNFRDSSILFRLTDSTFLFKNAFLKSNYLEDTSSLIVSQKTTLLLQNITILDSTKPSISSYTSEIRSCYLFIILQSTLDFQDFYIKNSTNFMFSSDSYISIHNFRLINFISCEGKRNFLSCLSCDISMQNISILDDLVMGDSIDTFFILRMSNMSLNNFEIRNSNLNGGSTFDLYESDIYLSNGIVLRNALGQNDNFINANQGINIHIQNINFFNLTHVMQVNNYDLLTISNCLFEINEPSNTIFAITMVPNIFFANIKIYQVQVTDSASVYISGVFSFISKVQNLNIENVSISNFDSRTGVLYIELDDLSSIIHLKNTTISNNRGIAKNGAGITIIYSTGASKITIEDSSFYNNHVLSNEKFPGRGAALLVLPKNFQQTVNSVVAMIKNCEFSSNFAKVNGGAIYSSGVLLSIDSNTVFFGNEISSGENNIATNPFHLRLVDPNHSPQLPQSQKEGKDIYRDTIKTSRFTDIGSGIESNQTIEYELLDAYGQLCIDDSSSILALEGQSKDFFTSQSSAQALNGIFTLEKVTFRHLPNSTALFYLRPSAISQISSPSFLAFNSTRLTQFDTSYTLEIRFRNCLRGEYVQDSGACSSCTEGFASFDFNLNTRQPCTKCDPVKSICLGGTQIGQKPGYWRMNQTANIFRVCPYKEACLGGMDESRGLVPAGECLRGYGGSLCLKCFEGFGKSGGLGGKCESCDSQKFGFFVFAVMFLVSIWLIGLSTRSQLNLENLYIEEQRVKKNFFLSSVLIKNFINYAQLVSIISNISIKWPSSSGYTMGALRQFVFIEVELISFECLFSSILTQTALDPAYLKLIVANLMPVVLALIALLFWGVLYFVLKKSYKKFTMWMALRTTLMIICFNQLIPVIQADLKLLQCENLYRTDDPIYFLTSDYQTRCWTSSHFKWVYFFVIPSLMIWGIIFPVVALCILIKNKKKLDSEYPFRRLSYIYKDYKHSKYYWEYIILIRKYLISLIALLDTSTNAHFQVLLSLYVMWLAYSLQAKNSPFNVVQINKLEKANITGAAMIVIAALYFNFFEVEYHGFSTLFTVFAFVAFFYYIFMFLDNYLLVIQAKLLNTKIGKWIYKKFPSFKRQEFWTLEHETLELEEGSTVEQSRIGKRESEKEFDGENILSLKNIRVILDEKMDDDFKKDQPRMSRAHSIELACPNSLKKDSAFDSEMMNQDDSEVISIFKNSKLRGDTVRNNFGRAKNNNGDIDMNVINFLESDLIDDCNIMSVAKNSKFREDEIRKSFGKMQNNHGDKEINILEDWDQNNYDVKNQEFE